MSRRLERTAALVATAGLAIATYLTVVHYTGAQPVCAVAHGCASVQQSAYAKLAGVPVALLGLLAYATILAALFRHGDAARLLAAFVAFVGCGFSAWLTYVEVARLDAICAWCVASAACMAALAVLTAVGAVGDVQPGGLAVSPDGDVGAEPQRE